jgi:hypothetical protein
VGQSRPRRFTPLQRTSSSSMSASVMGPNPVGRASQVPHHARQQDPGSASLPSRSWTSPKVWWLPRSGCILSTSKRSILGVVRFRNVASTPQQIARFARLPQRSKDVWQGGVIRMPTWVDGPDGTPYRPLGAVWVSLETGLMNVKIAEPSDRDVALAVAALIELGPEVFPDSPDDDRGDRPRVWRAGCPRAGRS